MLDELDLDEKTKSTLLNNIARRLTPQAVKVRADIEVSCYAYDGIDAVKTSLLEGLKCSSEDAPVKVCSDFCSFSSFSRSPRHSSTNLTAYGKPFVAEFDP